MLYLKRGYELGTGFAVDVALILWKHVRFVTYRLIDLESCPPSIELIVKHNIILLYLLAC